jgi:transporter family protein
MRYVVWAVVALCAYTAVPPLMKLTTRDIPVDVAVAVSNGMLTLVALALALRGGGVRQYLDHPDAGFMYAAGVFLTVGILGFYRAIEAGPVSRVVPIFGLFIATSSVVGVAVLDEPVTARKTAGIGLALAAVYLTTVE